MSSYDSIFLIDQPKVALNLSVCQCGWQVSKGGHSYGPMVRNYYVIHYVVRGKGAYTVNNKTYCLNRGDGFLMMPGDGTFYVADGEDPWEYYWVGFEGNEAEKLLKLSGLDKDNLIFSYTKDNLFEKHISDIYFASKNYPARSFAMLGYLYLLFSTIINEVFFAKTPQQAYLNKAIAYIEENYTKSISVTLVAEHIGVERSYLYRIFTDILGISVKEYIDSFRLTKAYNILCTTMLSIEEICQEAGFKEISHFTKKFKAAYGKSPTTLRKELQSQNQREI